LPFGSFLSTFKSKALKAFLKKTRLFLRFLNIRRGKSSTKGVISGLKKQSHPGVFLISAG